MKIDIPVRHLRAIENNGWTGKNEELMKSCINCIGRWDNESTSICEIDTKFMSQEICDALLESIKAKKFNVTRGDGVARRQLSAWSMVEKNPTGAKIGDLAALEQAIVEYVRPSERKWVYVKGKDDNMSPYILSHVKYHKAYTRGDSYMPAYTEVVLSAVRLGKDVNLTKSFGISDLTGKPTVSELFDRQGWFLETERLNAEYDKTMGVFHEWRESIGMQFTGEGVAENPDRWSRSTVPLSSEGVPHKLVIDILTDAAYKTRYVSTPYEREGVSEDAEDKNLMQAPEHQYVKVFDLQTHEFLYVHVANLKEYVYDETLVDKLILPEEHKDLIGILTQGTDDLMEDIVKGKTGGIIIAATGGPGLGKTLTAEVSSESVRKPLYIVQSAQLGISVQELEKELKTVLERAARWNAILLIDEADVFIRTRGNDIQQNAIVGVFLRVLEYYRGILFLTSNLGEQIDDAIMSRCTAHIKYEHPTNEAANAIWSVQRESFEDMCDFSVSEAVETFPEATGRDIKNLLKLAKLLANRKGEKVTIDLLKKVAPYNNVKFGN